MTALRNFANAPGRLQARPLLRWQMPAFAARVWKALHDHAQRRAARELELLAARRALSDPQMARQLRAAAAAARSATSPHVTESNRSAS